MKFVKTYLLIIVGAGIIFTANTETLKIPYLYIIGIVLLMLGLFNISKTIRSKEELENDRKDHDEI